VGPGLMGRYVGGMGGGVDGLMMGVVMLFFVCLRGMECV
jgi:hypothetical protein